MSKIVIFPATKIIRKWIKPYKRKGKKVNGYYKIMRIKTTISLHRRRNGKVHKKI